MSKLDLNNVTLACIDDVDPALASMIMHSLAARINFADVKLFSSKDEGYVTHKINPINSLIDYSVFAVREMHNYINSDFVMTIQRDGYPINLSAWHDEYLNYDYVGAPWNWASGREVHCPIGQCVGNGGFSIRSKKLMLDAAECAAEYDYNGEMRAVQDKHNHARTPEQEKENTHNTGDWPYVEVPEDVYVCRVLHDELISKGCKFAPVELASYFSIENQVYHNQFGFHGALTLKINKKIEIFKFKNHAYEKDYLD
tara:strand:+ start:131 stop:898 length:768 start_codon:yes stop_codon:yes gene_type:complete